MRNLITLIFFVILFLFFNVFGQEKIAHYIELECLKEMSNPVSLGFYRIDGASSLEDSLWQKLQKEINWREKSIIYPYETLESLKEDFQIESFKPSDFNALNKLKENLDIKLILTGKELDNQEIQISLIETDSGKAIFNNIYRRSKNSTPLQDLMKLFTDQKTTVYKTEIKNLPEMVLVKKGEIEVGTGYKRDTLKVENDFYISENECTIKQFAEFIDATGYKTDTEKNNSGLIWREIQLKTKNSDSLLNNSNKSDLNIVTNVSWYDAIAYCEWLSKETDEKYRLAKYNEWKFAASLLDFSEFIEDSKSNYNPKIKVSNDFKFIRENISDWINNENTVSESVKNYSLKQTLGVKNIFNVESFLICKPEYKRPNYFNTNISFRIVKEIR
jgi:formylglycine-generating enzyme required for sulfatase activity